MTAIEFMTNAIGRKPNADNAVWSTWNFVPYQRIRDIRRECEGKGFTGIEFDFAANTIRVDN